MRVLIVEDETAAVRNFKSLLRSVEPGVEVAGVTDSISSTLAWLESNKVPDIIFMDIHLADGDAFMIFDKAEVKSPVVFVTAYDRYALEAFRVNSIDYLLKPVQPADLRRALEKMKRLTSIELEAYMGRVQKGTTRVSTLKSFLIPVKDRIVPLAVEDIAFCHTSTERVSAYTFDGHRYPMDKSLDMLSVLLPENDFFRANRQFIISRSAVTDMTIWSGNRLLVGLRVGVPEKIIVSKNRVPQLKAWLSGT